MLRVAINRTFKIVLYTATFTSTLAFANVADRNV